MPGIHEMTAMSQLYTREMPMYDENLAYEWYTLPISQVHTRSAFLMASESKMLHLWAILGLKRPPDAIRSRVEEFEHLGTDV